MNETTREVEVSSDLQRLLRITEGVKGETCWKVVFGYGGDLHLHFGGKIPYDNPKLEGMQKGEWRFGTCGTPWTIFSPHGIVEFDGSNESTAISKLKTLENAKLVNFEITIPNNAVLMGFDNGCLFRLAPCLEEDDDDLPHWYFFTPHQMIVSFGPGKQWSQRRADVRPVINSNRE